MTKLCLLKGIEASNDYHFAVVNKSAPEAQQSEKKGPLRPMILAPKVMFEITATGKSFQVRNTHGEAAAIFVKPMLLDQDSHQLAYVVFNKAFVTIRAGESSEITVVEAGNGQRPSKFCVEAWNSQGRHCVPAATQQGPWS